MKILKHSRCANTFASIFLEKQILVTPFAVFASEPDETPTRIRGGVIVKHVHSLVTAVVNIGINIAVS